MTKTGEFMTFEPRGGGGLWFPSPEENHVHIGAYLPSGSANWTWIDDAPFTYPNWVTGYPALYPSTNNERYAAIMPDFDPQKGSWDDIGDSDGARAAVCAYGPCTG